MKIILGLTGSVATTIAPKIVKSLQEISDEVTVVMTDRAKHFYDPAKLGRECGVAVYTEHDEWNWPLFKICQSPETGMWKKGDRIQHIDLAKDASALVIAPATMNTIAKMANGMTDNLLTSLFAAWDTNRPVILAPAMNSRMWFSAANQRNLNTLSSWFGRGLAINVVNPIEKELACGDFGMGALADVSDIAKCVEHSLRWQFPLDVTHCSGIPVGEHLGAFGAFRGHGKRHCGVDLYVPTGEYNWVCAVECGKVVSIEAFTGPSAGCPWWNDTMAVKVEGASGTVCYGEITPAWNLSVGDVVYKGETVGFVKQVLKDGKLRPDIKGHSLSMLHLQLYKHGVVHKDESWMHEDKDPPDGVLDPTKFLLGSLGNLGQSKTL